ncbi:MAG: hypothetical protein DWQ02_20540 [Bacteroidetes bacterium]|nr:MAG: hypothetical protein DWQ02_20540 [Bacteroidota bacterium]
MRLNAPVLCETGAFFISIVSACKSIFYDVFLEGVLKKDSKKKSRLVFSWLLYITILFKNLNTEK